MNQLNQPCTSELFNAHNYFPRNKMTESDPWLNNVNNCYILFDPERKETMAKMLEFIKTKIDPVIILSCFIMNTHKYLDDFKINDAFVQEAIKKILSSETYDKDIIDKIRSLVFCGRNITTEAVFLHIWTTIIEKFLAEPAGDVIQESEPCQEAVCEVVN